MQLLVEVTNIAFHASALRTIYPVDALPNSVRTLLLNQDDHASILPR